MKPRTLTLLIVLALLAQSASGNDWPRYRRDTANGAEGLEQAITQASLSSLALRWEYATGAPVTASPVIATINSVPNVYVGSQNGVFYAINASTGAPVWTFNVGAPITVSGNVDTTNLTYGPVVYVAATNGCVYSLNAANGVLNWSHCYGTGVELFAPLFDTSHSRHLVVTYNSGNSGVIQALDETGGAVVWTFTNNAPFISPSVSTFGNYPGNNVLVATTASQLVGLDANTGAFLGRYTLGASAAGLPVLVTIGDFEDDSCGSFDTRRVYAVQGAGLNAYVVPLSSTTGFTAPVQVIGMSSAITAGPGSFFGSSSSSRTMRDPATGLLTTCLTSQSANKLFFSASSSILEALLIQHTGTAVTAGQQTIGSSPLNTEATFALDESDPFRSSGVVFVPSTSGVLYADTVPQAGVTAVFTAHGAIQASPAVAAGRIYFGDNAGYIYAVSPNGQ